MYAIRSYYGIPTYGAKASLNVVSALAIALHELRRRFDDEA